MKKILCLVVLLAICVTSFGIVASAGDATDLVWSLEAYKNSRMTSAVDAAATDIYLAVKLDVNPGMAAQKFDVIFDPTAVTYHSFSVLGDAPVVGYDEDGFPILGEPPEFVGKPFDRGVFVKPGDTLANGTVVTDFFRWVGGDAYNHSDTGVFVRLRFKINDGVQKSTKFKLSVDPANTGRIDPQQYYTSNSPEIVVPLKGYYSLYFDKNTTDEVTNLQPMTGVLNGSTYDLSNAAVPVRPGYVFLGWSTDTTAANITSSVTVSGSEKTVYAIWEEEAETESFTLSFDKNAVDAVTGMPAAQTLEKDVAFDLSTLPTPARAGYTFAGWSTDTTAANIVTSIALTADKTLYAIWTLNTHEVVVQEPTSTRPGLKEIRDDFGNVIRTEEIPVLAHFGNKRGLQVPATATANDETTTVRLILGVNSLEYLKAGFIVAAQDNLNKDGYTPGDEYSVLINSNTVYQSITAGGQTYTAAEFGAKYLVVIEITNFPKSAYNYDVRFQGFAVTLDGEYHFDSKVVTTVNTLITNK